ncbi:SMI1/KNR4 family protein [Kitasatospora sp. NPDC008115]|uniref:SMI1/KNR4 family protein n=1 Tax=Kitasatospora sp. NPDC008115 TaxID=3364022 RepID=UPI0036E4BE63
MPEYVELLVRVLGAPGSGRPAACEWLEVEAGLGVDFPDDYKEVAASYAPVQLNGHLILWHPATRFFNLAENVAQEIQVFEGIDWRAVGVGFRGEVPRFGGPGGLIPVARTDRGEVVFLFRDTPDLPWHVVGFSSDGEGFHEYDFGFAEWLYRYLAGEEVLGPGSATFHPGPLLIEDLPRSPGDRVVDRRGPDRGV